jgi:hypothetical protein
VVPTLAQRKRKNGAAPIGMAAGKIRTGFGWDTRLVGIYLGAAAGLRQVGVARWEFVHLGSGRGGANPKSKKWMALPKLLRLSKCEWAINREVAGQQSGILRSGWISGRGKSQDNKWEFDSTLGFATRGDVEI